MGFHMGQKVVCVDAERTNRLDVPELTEGAVYTIAWCAIDGQGLCVRLSEIPRRAIRFAGVPISSDVPFSAARFRPLRETNIDVFLQMLQPTPSEKVPA